MNYPRLRAGGAVSSFSRVPKDNFLLVADSERNADMLYAVRMFVPEPMIWFTRKDRPYVVVPDSVLGRVRRAPKPCQALAFSRYERSWEREHPGEVAKFGDILRTVLLAHRIKKVTVPDLFPIGLAKALRRGGIKVKLKEGALFPDRAFKTADEVKKINAAVVMAEVGISEGIHTLRHAKIGAGKRLLVHNTPLTAEKLRAVIETAILQAGGSAAHTVVACGRAGGDPHQRGHGPLLAHQPILIDVLPRSQRTGYYGDVARTVVRGRATEFVRAAFGAVNEASEAVQRLLRDGTPAVEAHREAERVFRERGYRNTRVAGRMSGFFHASGHGVGLDARESPRLSTRSRDTLRAGHVVAVGPSLRFPDVGGIRIEDVMLVTKNGGKNLTKLERQLEV